MITDLVIPFVLGLLVPFATAWIEQSHLPTQLETFLNAGLSALVAVLPTVVFDGSWQNYLVAVLVTWLGAMRSHYTQLPTKLWERDPYGRHASLDNDPHIY